MHFKAADFDCFSFYHRVSTAGECCARPSAGSFAAPRHSDKAN